MPRVVPPIVVEFIDSFSSAFADAPPYRQSQPTLDKSHAGFLTALLALVNELPGDLLVMTGAEYARFQLSIGEIQAKLAFWNSGSSSANPVLGPSHGMGGWHPVGSIRDLLSRCPSEALADAPSALSYVDNEQFRALLVRDVNATHGSLRQNDYKAATVMGGSVIEALLLWALEQCEKDEIRRAVCEVSKKRRWRREPPSNLRRWHLATMIPVARHLRIIGSRAAVQAGQARAFRNFIHPAAEIRSRRTCDRSTAFAVVAAVGMVSDDVARWANASV